MSQYYFFVSQLPLLQFGQTFPVAPSDFNAMCADYLSPGDLILIREAHSEDIAVSCPVLSSWKSWNRALRNTLATGRAKDQGIDPEPFLREDEYVAGVPGIAQEAMSAETPLQAEMILAEGAWKKLEELEVGHHFDIERILVYALKLEILQRVSGWEREAGEEVFQTTRQNMQEQLLVGEDPAWPSM